MRLKRRVLTTLFCVLAMSAVMAFSANASGDSTVVAGGSDSGGTVTTSDNAMSTAALFAGVGVVAVAAGVVAVKTKKDSK